MFADLCGFTAMTEHRDAEEVVVLVNACLAHFSECVYRYDGTIDKYIGDAVMALFGAPRTHEDDPERAIRAALDMQEALLAFKANPPLPLSADSQPDEDSRRHMLGTPAAAKLHAKAEPDGQYGS
jgi:class 3 adenylate cyclase